MSRCGRCGVIETEKILLPKQLGPILQDEKMDPFVLGEMMAATAQGLAIPSSYGESVLNEPKKKKVVLSPNKRISPINKAYSPPPSVTYDSKGLLNESLANSNNSKRIVDLNGKEVSTMKNNQQRNIASDLSNPKKKKVVLAPNEKKSPGKERPTLADWTEVPIKKNNQHKHVNRRSRAYSWQFVHNVILPKKIPGPVAEEQVQIQARPAVKEIMKLVSGTDDESLSAIEELLLDERRRGTSWRELADETIMELILREVDAFKFISTLSKAYNIPLTDIGLFLATPPDESTMSLMEEAVCQKMLGLFYEVLKMDIGLLTGLLSCKDTTKQVESAIFELLNNDEDLRRRIWSNQ